jgi:hypothetical protein
MGDIEKLFIPEYSYLYRIISNNNEGINNKNPKERSDEIREESPYKCNFCGRAFANRTTFEQHQFSKHRDQQTI